MGGYGRGHGSLPPSGPMGGAPEGGWYGQQEMGSGPTAGAVVPDQPQYDDPVANPGTASGSDPLSGMEQMRQALPEGGNEN